MKIGDYRNNLNVNEDLDLSLPQEEIVVNTAEPSLEVAAEPVVEEPTQPEVVVNQEVIEPQQPIITSPEVQAPVEEVRITDEMIFKNLSEKLGKEVKSISDLIQEQKDPLADDPYLKSLAEWRKTTGRPIEDWVKYQKDYSQMSDVDVVREYLQYKYPNFSSTDIEMELSDLLPDTDLDEERDIARKNLNLKKLAYEGRDALNTLKSDLGQPSNTQLSPELQADLELARQIKERAPLENQAREEYVHNIQRASGEMDKFKINLADNLSIDYSISEKDRQELPDFVNTMPHWRHSDGSWNHKAVIEDAVKIKYFDHLIKTAYEQGLNSGKDEAIKTANNITLTEANPASANVQTQSNVIIEGLDNYLGSGGAKIRFGK